MKVVVTGGSGQLGSLVLARLAQSRKVKRVVSLDLVPPSIASAKPRCPTVTDVLRHFDAVTPRRLDSRLAVYFRLVDTLGRRVPANLPEEARRVSVDIRLDITGPRGGDFGWHLHEGKERLSAGIPRPPSASITLSPETLLALLTGQDDLSTARMAGRVRVSGEPSAELAFTWMITVFHSSARKSGLEGALARRLERWFSGEKGSEA